MFYLKYRPQKIAELDLVEIRNGLAKVLSSGHIPHAFLFAGPRGTGKTSAARIISKAVNCERRSEGIVSLVTNVRCVKILLAALLWI